MDTSQTNLQPLYDKLKPGEQRKLRAQFNYWFDGRTSFYEKLKGNVRTNRAEKKLFSDHFKNVI